MAKVALRDTGRVDHLASAYVLLEPQLRPGGVVILTELPRFQWRRQLVLVSRDSVRVRPLDPSGPVEIPDWDAYEQVLLTITSTDLFGIGLEYSVSVEYDPELSGQSRPLALSLGQNYPNPFRTDAHGETVFPFELSHPSQVTRLSIVTPNGELVRRFEMGPSAPRSYTQGWDGRNEAGKPVNSGIYYCVLETDGGQVRKSVAVIRE